MGAMPASRYAFGSVPWYSVLIVSAIVIGLSLCGHEQKRLKLPADLAIDLALCLIPSAIVGARLYYVAFSWDVFAADPLRILRIWEGGLAIYGGILGGAIALLLFCAVRHMPLLQLADILVPALALGQGIGRWGNYFNMEAYGRLITNPQWQFFPAAVLIPVDSGYEWHMATFFYESCVDVLIFLVLWFGVRKRKRWNGQLLAVYMLMYGIGRAVIEGLRDGTLQAIATDHAPHTPEEKADFLKAPNGAIGMETSLAAGLTYLVKPGHLSLMRLIETMSTWPAKLLHIPAGTLRPGAAADLVLFDPDKEWTVDVQKLHGTSRNCCFKGMTLTGQVLYTFLGGELVFSRG